MQIIRKYHFEYLSCTRAKTPFIYETPAILEIPSDLPCFEELDPRTDVATLGNMIGDGGNHVLPVHAEVEGGIFEEKFRELLKNILGGGIMVTGLHSMKAGLDIRQLNRRKPEMELLPGRHSPCAV